MAVRLLRKPNARKQRFAARYAQNAKGATALEFAILGIPFMALLFGIIELAVIFFIGSIIEHATAEASRDIRTGEFQSAGNSSAAFKDAICANMSGVGSCDNLRVDVISAATGKFTDLSLPSSPEECTGSQEEIDDCQSAPPVLPADTYTATIGGDVVIVRTQYFHTLAVPSALTKLANSSGNTRVITAVTAFRNEPFGGNAPVGGG